MDDAQQHTLVATPLSSASTSASAGSGRQVIPGLLGGVAVLALIGAAVFMLRGAGGAGEIRTDYPPDLVNGVLVYDVNDLAPTSFGSLVETSVHVTNADDGSEVDVSLSVENKQWLPMTVPALSELRVINEHGAAATYLGGGWHDGQIVLPHMSASGDFRFAAPPGGGTLILEYQEHADETPVRVAVGYALEHPDAAQLNSTQ